jgi:glycine oxidase
MAGGQMTSINSMPSDERGSLDVAVIGAGIVGLAVAWRARARGLSVAVLERARAGAGASWVAAGMLAPVAEVEFGEHGRRVLELGLRSAAMWPRFAHELERASGVELQLQRTGTLMVAYDDDEARELERQLELRHSLGLRALRLRASQAREREPALAPVMRLGLEAPDDHSLDPRLALAALRAACEREGVEIRERAPVDGLAVEGERVVGVLGVEGLLAARQVVVAAGSWSAQLDGLPPGACVPVRPVKGQIMLLRDPAGPGLLSRAVRYTGGYLVPRGDGRYVLGGTVEERGFDPQPTAGAVYELLRRAHELVPGVSELELLELNVGYRPGTPDNAPIVGRGSLEGLIWATGHYRNGILLTPLTAELVAGLLAGEPPSEEELLARCDPARFASANAHTTEAEGALS